MKKIPLTRGLFAKVDDADHAKLSGYRWFAGCGGKYACRMTTIDGKRSMVYMHREIVLPGDGMQIDHKNGDGLDNRRRNLRECAHADNVRNRVEKKDVWYPKGVTKRRKKFVASVTYRNAPRHLGSFCSASGAALAYSWACGKLFGEFYRTTPFEGRKA